MSEGSSKTCSPLDEASTVFVLEGSGRALTGDGSQIELHPGQAFLLPASLELRLETQGEGISLYRTSLGC